MSKTGDLSEEDRLKAIDWILDAMRLLDAAYFYDIVTAKEDGDPNGWPLFLKTCNKAKLPSEMIPHLWAMLTGAQPMGIYWLMRM